MSADSRLPGLRPRTTADLQRAREQIPWVEDDDLRSVEYKSLASAGALSFFTWGGGHLYVGKPLQGFSLLAALLTFATLVPSGSLATAIYFVVSLATTFLSVRNAKDLNRFVAIRNEVALLQGPDPSAYRLLTAAAMADPSLAAALPAGTKRAGTETGGESGKTEATEPASPPAPRYAALLERLRKLVALHRAGVLTDVELHDRKLDLLQDAAPATREELDDLLYELLPLAGEAVLDEDDFEFLKQVGGVS